MDQETVRAALRALAWFDRREAPGLRADGMPVEGVDHCRADYVQAACASPLTVRVLRAWEAAGMPDMWETAEGLDDGVLDAQSGGG
jgi:hypothetical protein